MTLPARCSPFALASSGEWPDTQRESFSIVASERGPYRRSAIAKVVFCVGVQS